MTLRSPGRVTVPMTEAFERLVLAAADQRKMPVAEMIRRILEAHLCEKEEAA